MEPSVHLPLSIPRFSFLYSFIAYALLSAYALSAASNYDLCKNNSTCGKVTLQYPFGVRNLGCGLPDFQIDCVEKVRPVLRIESVNYTILQVFPNETCLIINDQFFEEDCNSFLDLPEYSGNSLLSITEQHITNLSVYKCGGLCVPDQLYQSVIPSCGLTPETESIREGLASWMIDEDPLYRNCTDCIKSNGYCGYNISNEDFLCFCENGLHPYQCPPGKKNHLGAIIGGSVGGVLLIAAVLLTCKITQRRRKNRHPPRGILIDKDVTNSYSKDIEAGVQGKIGNLPIFSYEILKEATDNFAEEKILGDGGFGSVYLGKLPDGRAVAVKRMYQDNWRRVDQFINEVEILSSLHHPNLVRLYGCTSPESSDLLLVYEYVQNGTVADHLHGDKKGKGLDWEIRLKISLETAQALAFLHSQVPPVLHRDVKTTNILLDENFKVKVADFGLSRFMPPNVTHVSTAPQGTPGYLDPEYHECFQLTEKSDVYSFGVVLVELISAKLAVDINRTRKEIALANMALSKIREGALQELVDPSLAFDSDNVKTAVTAVAELAFRCLQSCKDDRPSMKEIVAQLEQTQQNWGHACDLKNPDSESFGSNGAKDKVFIDMTPPSPTSVQDKWPSTKTTPNNSA